MNPSEEYKLNFPYGGYYTKKIRVLTITFCKTWETWVFCVFLWCCVDNDVMSRYLFASFKIPKALLEVCGNGVPNNAITAKYINVMTQDLRL